MSTTTSGGAALADLMRRAGLSQDKLAKQATATGHKLNQSQVSGLLSGGLGFTIDSAKACATVLDVPVTTFLPELATLVPQSPMTGDSRIKRFPLADLMLAKGNERTSYLDAGIDDLARQIKDAGTLYQNLVGYLEGDKVAVWDGGRRWRALRRLAEWGEVPPVLQEFGIPVLLLEDRVACMTATIAANQKEDTHFLDRGAALARLQDETGWKAPRLARETNAGSERLVQQLLQIHRALPDWAKDRAYLPKDDPQHLKFRDCRDMVEESRAAAPGAPPSASPEQEKGEVQDALPETPLPLVMPPTAPASAPPVRFTKEQVAEGLRTFIANPRGTAEPPVADRVMKIVSGRSDLFGIGRDTLLSDALSKHGMVAVAADLAEEFAIILLADDVSSAKTVAGLVRAVINAPRDTGSGGERKNAAGEDPRHVAVGGRIGRAWVLHAVQFKLFDRPALIELKNSETGQIVGFVPAQRDIEGD